jgi:hypothetical protein
MDTGLPSRESDEEEGDWQEQVQAQEESQTEEVNNATLYWLPERRQGRTWQALIQVQILSCEEAQSGQAQETALLRWLP